MILLAMKHFASLD